MRADILASLYITCALGFLLFVNWWLFAFVLRRTKKQEKYKTYAQIFSGGVNEESIQLSEKSGMQAWVGIGAVVSASWLGVMIYWGYMALKYYFEYMV